ncbi:MAG TPA: 5-formyltetrahydrofolate cyclo-ligase [Casimicrobiaceae bacterium]|nr:5-formyltetrahydrofolate cyclo-ligase [Casimicrobiaceae bacterium]
MTVSFPMPSPSSPSSTRKAELRTLLLARRNALAVDARERMSDSITRSVLALDAYRRARVVMAYMTFGSEFATGAIIDAAIRDAKAIVLPRIDRAHDRLAIYTVCEFERDLAAGPWGIREPRPDTCLGAKLSEIDFILVPGLGFTVRGDRLGYGRGYYDRLLAERDPRTALVAAAFSVQVVDELPTTPQDVRIDMVITERDRHVASR